MTLEITHCHLFVFYWSCKSAPIHVGVDYTGGGNYGGLLEDGCHVLESAELPHFIAGWRQECKEN